MSRTRSRLCAFALLASSCGTSAPSAPAPVTMVPVASAATQLTGTWNGLARVMSCSDSKFGNCDYLDPYSGFAFTLAKTEDGWSGTVEFEEPTRATVEVVGVEAPDGRSVTLSGATTPTADDGWMATVSSLRLEPDAGNGLVGTMSYAYRHAGPSARTVTLTGSITSAARGPAPVRWDNSSSVPSNVDGTWRVSTLIESCSHWLTGPCANPSPDPSALTLVIRGSTTTSPRAVVEFPVNVVAELSGTREADGSLRFTGSGESPWDSFFRVDVSELVVRADAGAGLTGRFAYDRQHSATRNHPAGVASASGTITSAKRGDFAFSPGPFHGSWSGDVLIDVCLAGDCSPIQVGGTRTLRLALTQSGPTVVGSMHLLGLSIPLAGTASGESVRLDGDIVPSQCSEISMYSYQCGQHVRNSTLTLDDFGRITGAMDYTFDGSNGATPYSYTIRLVFVAVVPDL